MKWICCGWKQSWTILSHYAGTGIDRVQDTQSPCLHLNPEIPECDALKRKPDWKQNLLSLDQQQKLTCPSLQA